jgi:hypothetical protein
LIKREVHADIGDLQTRERRQIEDWRRWKRYGHCGRSGHRAGRKCSTAERRVSGGRHGFTRNTRNRRTRPALAPGVNIGAFVATRRQISVSCEMALRLGQPPAFSVNEARLGARGVHQAIVLGPPEETLCQLRALFEALGDQARCCGAKVDDWRLRRLDQTIEVPRPSACRPSMKKSSAMRSLAA